MTREAATADDLPAVMAAFDRLGDSLPVGIDPRDLEAPCRCGWPDESRLGTPPVRVPVRDLTAEAATGCITFERSPAGHACRSCTHTIGEDVEHVVHRLSPAAAVHNRFHSDCVEIR